MAASTSVAAALESLATQAPLPERRVKTCYSLFDAFFPRLGFLDLTEGIYDDAHTSFERAQANQHDYLLDQLHCGPGSRVLDIGCGYGTFLARARDRGANVAGITLSPEQDRRCQQANLGVRVLDYRALGAEWNRSFDGVVANGSAEHFVQPPDALAGRDDAMFRIVRRLIDPDSPSRRFVTTTIHFVTRPRPADILRHPLLMRRGTADYHFAWLTRSFGGWYPALGQLERCARGYFKRRRSRRHRGLPPQLRGMAQPRAADTQLTGRYAAPAQPPRE